MYELDVAATQAINSLAGRSALLDSLMIWVSAIGVPVLVLAVAGQWWRKGDRPHARHVLIAAGFSFLLGLALNQLILLFVHRMRPYDAGISHLLIAPSADPSFPSDHATATIAIRSPSRHVTTGAGSLGLVLHRGGDYPAGAALARRRFSSAIG
jgi:undecaprenyl-diphosphatase